MKLKASMNITCDTTIELENLTYEEYTGIQKFISKLRNADNSNVEITISANCTERPTNNILQPGDTLWFTERIENMYVSCFGKKLLYSNNIKTPIPHKILQVIINKDGVKYQISGNGLHISHDIIGLIAFTKYEDAIESMRHLEV